MRNTFSMYCFCLLFYHPEDKPLVWHVVDEGAESEEVDKGRHRRDTSERV